MTDPSKTIIITGATDGIGLALAQRYQQQSTRLVLIGRRPLAALNDPLFSADTYCQADLSLPNAPQIIQDWLQTQRITSVDLLIHNAGLGYVGDVAAQAPADLNALLQVNIYAPIALTHALLPALQQATGKVVFISSVATAFGMDQYAAYIATKAALNGVARSLRIELAPQISVQLILPGATRTGMHAKAGVTKAQMDWDKFPPAAQVAQKIQHAIASGRRQVVIGTSNKAIYGLGTLLGRRIDTLRTRTKGKQSAQQPVCLITGFADGIGKALACKFAETHHIVGIDVDAARATATQAELRQAGGTCDVILADLTDVAHPTALAAYAQFDVVIHNAGISAAGKFAALPMAQQRKVLDLNLRAPLLLTTALIKAQQLAPHGTLAFISSLSHFVSYPGASVYAASKDGLALYARSVALAVKPNNTNVLTVFPGPTRTAHARRYSPDNSREHTRLAPEALAAQIYLAAQRRKRQHIPGVANKFVAQLGILVPRLTEWLMRKTIFEKL